MPVAAMMPNYPEDDEHILRRLGAAVVGQWDALPENIRSLLVEQATFMHDRYQTVQLRQQIDAFIEDHKGWTK
jgi:hypothetical protein